MMELFTPLKQRVYKANMRLTTLGLVILTWGNVSEIDRENGVIAIKPRGIEYQDLTAQDMVLVDLDGHPLEGGLLPSVDLDIHLELYRNFPCIGAVAHTHSTWATAWAQRGRDLPVCGTTHADHFFGDIPCVPYPNEAETAEDYERHTGRLIVETFRRRNIDPAQMRAALCAGHGPFTWGKDAAESVEYSYILEEIAKICKLSEENGRVTRLPQYLVDKHYLRKYGKNAYFYQTKP